MSRPAPPSREARQSAAQQTVEARHNRLPPTAGRIQAFEWLATRLVDHAQLYETGGRQNQRDAIGASLVDISDFLSCRGLSNPTLRPIWRVIEALAERERGATDPIFTERGNRSRGGRPEKPVRVHQQDGVIAAFANFWIEHNADKTRTVRSQLGEIARLLDGNGLGTLSAARIKQARETVSQEAADHPARGMHDTVAIWLERTAQDYGCENTISVLLPIVAQLQMIWRD